MLEARATRGQSSRRGSVVGVRIFGVGKWTVTLADRVFLNGKRADGHIDHADKRAAVEFGGTIEQTIANAFAAGLAAGRAAR